MRKANNKLLKIFASEDAAKQQLLLLNQTQNITQIAKKFGVLRDTVSSWFRRFAIEQNQETFKTSLTGRKRKKDPDKSIITKEFLSNLYYNQHKTQSDIAKETGIARWTIQHLFKEYDIAPRKCRNKNTTLEAESLLYNRDWLYDQYVNQQKSFIQLGIELGVADVTVAKRVEEFGIPKQRCAGNYIWSIFKDDDEARQILIELNKELSLTEIAIKYNINVGSVSLWFKRFDIVPNIHFTSIPQKILQEYITSIGVPYTSNDRKVLGNNLEIDIFCEDQKIGIEVDGIHFHSELFVDKKYHKNKTDKAELAGIRLLHFYDIEIQNKFPIVCSILSNIFRKPQTIIYARNTTIEQIKQSEANLFYEINHLQGKTTSKYHYALIYNKEVVSLMSFSPSRFNRGVEFELTRFCSKLNTRVIGAGSKLFSHFITNLNPTSVISYADRRIFNGSLYEKLGFRLHSILKEDYHYIQNKTLIRKEKMQHKNMKILLPNYDSNKSEHQNALENRIYRIYDCGKLKYIWTKPQIL